MSQNDAKEAFQRLLEIMSRLRGPDGCPWDREQTPESLAPFILEEACEVIDAIEEGDPEAICEELGDLLLQVVFQACIFSERESFDISAVAHGICDKLVRRHPHVFSDLKIHDPEELKRNWERIKADEKKKKHRPAAGHQGDIPSHLPALMRAQKILEKNPDAEQAAIQQTSPILSALAASCAGEETGAAELGDTLLALAVMGNRLGIDCEQTLRRRLRTIS